MHSARFLTAGTIAFLSTAGLVRAEITADDVRGDIFSLLNAPGLSYSIGSETRSGDTLVIKDIRIDIAPPDGKGGGTIAIDWMRFREIEGGKVDITFDPEIIGRFHGIDQESDQPVTWRMTLSHVGSQIVVSGDGKERRYQSRQESLELMVDEVQIGENPMPFLLTTTFRDNTSDYFIRSNEQGGFDYDTTGITGSVIWLANFTDTDGNKVSIKGNTEQLHLTSHGRIVPFEEGENPFEKGMELEVYYEAGGGKTEIVAISPQEGETRFGWSEGPSSFDFAASREIFRLALSGEDIAFTLETAQLPAPVELRLGKLSFESKLPFSTAPSGKPYKLAIALEDMAAGDALMDMFDPQKIMPRDPATLRIALSGAMRWLVDPMDTAAMDAFEGPTPVVVDTLSLDELFLEALGALVKGSGLVTLDNSAVEMGGPPMPHGKLSFELEGIYATIDRLKQMGVLSDDDATGVLAMLGVFTRPAGEGDRLVSEIEFTDGGGLVVNGQPLQ